MPLRIDVDQAWTGICGESRDVQLESRSVMNRTDYRHLAARTHAFDKLVSVKRASTNMSAEPSASSMTPSRADSTGAIASKSRPLFI